MPDTASGRNAPWTLGEIRVIVDIYFEMLEYELSSANYVKAGYNREIQAKTGRSRQSVDYKFCNISHVLKEAGYPSIDGYKPRSNTQSALRDVVLKRAAVLPYLQSFGQDGRRA
ncbi:hypothetical protein [Sinomonas mesophila]|uniref:hypothetical protein n=1 Tax=Sinomonas mesophila TaxID=1531955 RepID=UPI0011158690|nr:hypothetical protein [Sinomonas mesophila]